MKFSATRLLSTALLVTLPFGLGGCNSKLPGAAAKVTLTYWGLFEHPETVAPLIAGYQKLHPNVTINYSPQTYTTLASYKETVLTRLKGGTSGTVPDILRIHASWVPGMYQNLSPLPTTVYSPTDFSQTFYPAAAKSLTIGTNIYGIPLMYDGLALVYNTDLFAEAGITSPPTTWEDFRAVAVKLTKLDARGRIDQSGAAIGLSSNVAFGSDLLNLMWAQSSLKIPDDLGTQAASDALTFYTNFAKQDKVWDSDLPYSVTSFANGKVGMIFVPSWTLLDITGINPSIKYAVAPVPQVPSLTGSQSSVNWASFWVESVAKSSPNSAAAWDFLKYLSEKSTQQQFYSETAKIRPYGELYSRRDLRDSLLSDKNLSPYISGAESAVTGAVSDRAGNDFAVAAVNDAISAAAAGTDAKTALGICQKTLQQLGVRSL
ncbi:MAG: extracellular solute-binding protein [candidate division WWE3 bacterium]|nr:extracellular solute-binding protein [candidate division WWE3 bacterium]